MLINDMISKFLNVQSQNANKNKNLKRNEMKWDACYIENLNFVSLWHSNDKPKLMALKYFAINNVFIGNFFRGRNS